MIPQCVYQVPLANFKRKHTPIGLGLHSMTGQKLPIPFLSGHGNSISYDMVNQIDTAQAEVAKIYGSSSVTQPVQSKAEEAVAPTLFWWDNFDRKIETTSGKGSTHNTPEVAFQEITDDTTLTEIQLSISKSDRRSLEHTDSLPVPPKINSKRNTSLFPYGPTPKPTSRSSIRNDLLPIWKLLRYIRSYFQIYPRFVGWVTQLYRNLDKKQTVLTYLSPIQRPITVYGTIIETFICHQYNDLSLLMEQS